MKEDGLQLCRSYVSALRTSIESKSPESRKLAAVTISREAGARGRSIAGKLVIDDPHDYALVINTDRLSDEDVANVLRDRVVRMES